MGSNVTQLLYVSRSAMLARLMDLDAVGNNLANVNTPGYKATRVNFQELMHQADINGLHPASTQALQAPGSLRTTSNGLDLAITGGRFFCRTTAGWRDRVYPRRLVHAGFQ